MGRKKVPMEETLAAHYVFVANYFDRAIRTQKILRYTEDEYEAKEAFKKLKLYANDNESVMALKGWITQYVSDHWERCKTAIRQHTLMQKQRYQYQTFRIPRDLSYAIKRYAEQAGLSKFAAMEQAIDLASNLLEANENKKRKK